MSTITSFLRSKIKALIVTLIVTSFLFVWLAYSISWSEVYTELKKVSYWYLIPGTLVSLIQSVVRAMRWRLLLTPHRPTSFMTRFNALAVGNFATFVLPLRAGEFLRPLYLSKKSSIGYVECLVSVVLERFFDLASVLLLFVLGTYLLPDLPIEAKLAASSLLVAALAILIVALCGALCPQLVRNYSDLMLRYFPNTVKELLVKVREDFIAGSAVLSSVRNWFLLIVWCALVWGLTIYGYEVMLGLVMQGFQWRLALALTVISAFAVALPSMPGFVVVFQWACIGSFVLFGFSKELAVTFSIVVQLQQYVFNITLGGLVFLVDWLKRTKS